MLECYGDSLFCLLLHRHINQLGKGQIASLTWNRFYKMYSLKHIKILLISNVVIAYYCVYLKCLLQRVQRLVCTHLQLLS